MPLSQFQPANYASLLAEKVSSVCDVLQPFYNHAPQVFASEPEGYRMRAEFRVWHEGDALNYVMYRPDDRKTPVPIDDFPIAHSSIRQLMNPLLDKLKHTPLLRQKLFQVEFLATLSGDLLVTLIYHRKLNEQWEAAAQQLRDDLSNQTAPISIIGRSRKQKIVLQKDHVVEALDIAGRTFSYVQVEQSFTQPNARVNIKMIEWACAQARGSTGDLLELYCGNGNFTLPLAQYFDSVIATELSKVSTRAALQNAANNQISNVQIIRLSAEEVAEAMAGGREFRRLQSLPKPLDAYALNTLFVDPPRAGLDPQTLQLASQFPVILYVSCNHQTLAGNLALLGATHEVTDLALFDQFPYTHHMECGVVLRRKGQSV